MGEWGTAPARQEEARAHGPERLMTVSFKKFSH